MRLLLAALLAATALATPARAEVTQPTGRLCSVDLFTLDRATVYGGPLTVADEDDPSAVHPATLTCSLRYGDDHTATEVFSATGPATPGAVALPPTVFEPDLDTNLRLVVCTRVDHDGGTLYWHDPADRNEDGWWSTDPGALCEATFITADIKPQDPIPGYAIRAGMTVAGELGPVVAAAEPVACSVPEVDAAAEGLACGAPVPLSTMSFARVPGGAVVRTLPAGRTCTDAHSGAVLAVGSALVTPDPGMACVPSDPAYPSLCDWQELSGYLVPTTLGRVTVTQGCGAASISRVLAAGQGRLVEQWSGNYTDNGTGTLRCGAVEDATGPAEPAYVVLCHTV